MGLTKVRIPDGYDVWGRHYVEHWALIADTSYPAGGYPLTAADVGLKQIQSAEIVAYNALAAQLGVDAVFDGMYNRLVFRKGGPRVVAYTPGGGDVLASANTNQLAADQAANAANGAYIDTLHAVAGGAWAYSEDAEPDCPRNVCISWQADAGGDTLPTIATIVVTGSFRGIAKTETIVQDFTGVTAVAANQFRFGYGLQPFDTITNVVITPIAAGQNGLFIGVGIGSKFGLPEDIAATGDVYKLTKLDADLSPANIVDATYMTVNFGTVALHDANSIHFLAKGEVDAGRNLAVVGVVARFIGI